MILGAAILRRVVVLAALATTGTGLAVQNSPRQLTFVEINKVCTPVPVPLSIVAGSVQTAVASSAPLSTPAKKSPGSPTPNMNMDEASQKASIDPVKILESARVTRDELERKKQELLLGEAADPAAGQMTCVVALWQLSHAAPSPSRAKSPAPSRHGWNFGPLSVDETDIALGVAIAALGLALASLAYSRSATRRALRDAGLL